MIMRTFSETNWLNFIWITGKSSSTNSTHYAKLHPQNCDRIVTIDSVTSMHLMYSYSDFCHYCILRILFCFSTASVLLCSRVGRFDDTTKVHGNGQRPDPCGLESLQGLIRPRGCPINRRMTIMLRDGDNSAVCKPTIWHGDSPLMKKKFRHLSAWGTLFQSRCLILTIQCVLSNHGFSWSLSLLPSSTILRSAY